MITKQIGNCQGKLWHCADTNGNEKFSVFADTLISLSQDVFAGRLNTQTFIFKGDPFQIKSIEKNVQIKRGNPEYYLQEKSGLIQLSPLKGEIKNQSKKFDKVSFWNDQLLARTSGKWFYQPSKPEELLIDSFRIGENQLILFIPNGLVKIDMDLRQKFIPVSGKEKILSPGLNFVKIDNTWIPLESGIPIPERGKSFWWGNNILVDSSKGVTYVEGQSFSVKLRSDSIKAISKNFLLIKDRKQQIIITSLGKKIKLLHFSDIVIVSDTQVAVKNKKNWILIGLSGQKYNVNTSISTLKSLRGGNIIVKAGKRYGFIDPGGFIRISCRYDSVLDFEENLAGAKLGNSWGFLDKNERLQIQPNFQKVSSFLNGLAVVKKNEKCGLISTGGQFATPLDYEEILPFTPTGWLLRRGNWWGYATKNGEITITPRFFNIIGATSTLMKIQRDGKSGLMNRSGKLILDLEYKFIQVDKEFSNIIFYQ